MEIRAVRRMPAIQICVDRVRGRTARHHREMDRANGEWGSPMSGRTSTARVGHHAARDRGRGPGPSIRRSWDRNAHTGLER
ncbi:hypothetical protein GD429_00820 [Burkholderia sp. BE17]|nr:hypothetical protein [Burkholderia sp. BE17]